MRGYSDIGRELGISHTMVRKIEQKALQKLRHSVLREMLEVYDEEAQKGETQLPEPRKLLDRTCV